MIGSNLATTYEFFIKVILLAYSVVKLRKRNCNLRVDVQTLFCKFFVSIFFFFLFSISFYFSRSSSTFISDKNSRFFSFLFFGFLPFFLSFLILRSLNEFRSSAYSAAEYELFNCHSVSDTLTMFACGQYL